MADEVQQRYQKAGYDRAAGSTTVLESDTARLTRDDSFGRAWAAAGARFPDENDPDDADSTARNSRRNTKTSSYKEDKPGSSSKNEDKEKGDSSSRRKETSSSSKGKEKEQAKHNDLNDYVLGSNDFTERGFPRFTSSEHVRSDGNDFLGGIINHDSALPYSASYPLITSAYTSPHTDDDLATQWSLNSSQFGQYENPRCYSTDKSQQTPWATGYDSYDTLPQTLLETVDETRTQKEAYRKQGVVRLLGKEEFKLRRSRDFVPGRLLKIFWFEPNAANSREVIGSSAQSLPTVSKLLQSRLGSIGKIRRFVIVETRNGHSVAIPINTYNYQGTLKPGCRPDDHAMIYTNPEPDYLPGEAPLRHPKVRVVPLAGEALCPESRVNYGKKYTIEHNFCVAFIGRIAEESSNDFWLSFNTVNSFFYPPSGPPLKSTGQRQKTSSKSNSQHVSSVKVSSTKYAAGKDEHVSPMEDYIPEIPPKKSVPAETTIVRPVPHPPQEEKATETRITGDQGEDIKSDGTESTIKLESNVETRSGEAAIVFTETEEAIAEDQPATTDTLDAGGANAVSGDEVQVREYGLPSYEEAADAMRPFVQNNTLIPQENMQCHNDLFISWPETELADVKRRLGNRTKGTCEWILSKGPCRRWENHDGAQVLRLLGKQAAGKTMLLTFLVEHWTLRLQLSSSLSLAYWFCNSGRYTTNTATGIVRGLLYQILQQRPHNYHHLQQVYDVHGKALFEDFGTLWTIFMRVLDAPAEEDIVILIDGLDECDEHSRRLILDGMVEISKTNIKARVLFTERAGRSLDPALHRHDCKIITLSIESEDNELDVHKYTNEKVATLEQKNGLSAEQTVSLTEALKANMAGTFPGLIVNMLTKIEGCDDMMQAVGRIPEDATSAYREYLNPDHDQTFSDQNIFKFLDTLPGDPGGEYKGFAERELRKKKEARVKPQEELPSSHSSSSVLEATPESSDAGRDHFCTDCKAPRSRKSMTITAALADTPPWKQVLAGFLVLLALLPRLSVICGLLGFIFAAGILLTTLEHALIAFQSRHDILVPQGLKQRKDTADSDALLSAEKPSLPNTSDQAPDVPEMADQQDSVSGTITASNPNPYTNTPLPMHNGNQAPANPERNNFAFVASITTLCGRFLTFLQRDDQNPNNPPPAPDPNDFTAAAEFTIPDGFKSWIITCLIIFVLLGMLSVVAQSIACTKLSDFTKLPGYVAPTWQDSDFFELLSASGFLIIDICFSMAVIAIHVAEHNNSSKWTGLYILNTVCVLTVPVSARLYVGWKYVSKGIACFGQLIQASISFWTVYKLEQRAARQRWTEKEEVRRKQRRDSEEAARRHQREIETANQRYENELRVWRERTEVAERAAAGLRRRAVPAAGDEGGGDIDMWNVPLDT